MQVCLSVCNLTTIKSLSLQYCNLSAMDPAHINLVNLESLDISNNLFYPEVCLLPAENAKFIKEQ